MHASISGQNPVLRATGPQPALSLTGLLLPTAQLFMREPTANRSQPRNHPPIATADAENSTTELPAIARTIDHVTTVQEREHVSVFASEAELIQRAQQGDGEAFASLLRTNDRAMRACAYQLLGNQSNMDDALQDAYIKAFQSLNTFRGESKFSSWLYRIVYRTCLDQQRYRSRRPQVSLEHDTIAPQAEAQRNQADSSQQIADRELLQNALAQLPEDQAAVIILVDAEGFTYDEVAETLDMARGTIASRLSRGRTTLRTLLTASSREDSEDTDR